MPSYKLRYFENVKGRPEYIYFMFAAAKADLQFESVSMDKWPTIKDQQPFHQLPVMYVDGKEICQTQAIGRLVAKQLGFAGSNEWESALCDQFVDGYVDLFNGLVPALLPLYIENDFAKGKKIYDETIYAEKVKPFMDIYEKFLKKNGGKFLVGNKVTWADFAVAELLNRLQGAFSPNLFEGYPNLEAQRTTVFRLPGVGEYNSTRPEAVL